ncbi:MAG: UPF0182 family protein [Clostridiales Family XIII bacterium]|nr:UPF0182 family protein [Clostridiales Family XIII bacterium]
MNKRRFGLFVLIVVLLALIGIAVALVGFITDYLWFRELGYTSVFLKKLFTQLEIGIPLFLVVTILGYFYLKVIKRGYLKRISVESALKPKTINLITVGLAAVASGALTYLTATTLWFEALKFTNSTEFSIADPIFNNDVSFYVFKLQFITQLNQIFITVIIGFAIMTVLYYMILLSLYRPKLFETVKPDGEEGGEGEGYSPSFEDAFGNFGETFQKGAEMLGKMMGLNMNTGQKKPASARRKSFLAHNNLRELLHIASNQIIVLGVIFFLMVAVNFFLRQYDLLYSNTGVLFGASFTDINVTLWMFRALIVLALAGMVFFTIGIKKKDYKMVLSVPVVMIVVGALGTGAGYVVQSLVVSPDEINKETKYLEYSIKFTQNAYDLQNVETRQFQADDNLKPVDIQNNADTISNIRINDYAPAKDFYNNTQTIRNYYLFNDVDVDRYMVNGEYTQTFLSAREVSENLINTEWINRYLKYTHGYGITLSRVDKVTASGQPDLLIRDIPPRSLVEEIQVDRPEIYFGELTDNYVLVNTNELEFDYPTGDENAFTTYEGTAGIPLNFLNKTLFSIREQSLKLLVSSNINSKSKILINRNIMKRVREIMPYVMYDENPYIVTVGGKLYWIIDAYTYSSYYPYSEPYDPMYYGNRNYIRNSVKVVVDAYNGTASYYLVDDQDPVANTYKKIFPALFKSYQDMPDDIRAHIRYPAKMLDVQANMYKRYHVDNVNVFYQGEDIWDIALEILGASPTPEPMHPQYYVMKLPGEQDVEFINSIPFTPRTKKNLTGYLVARNDGDHYGELLLYQLPKSKWINGPEQVEALIDQNDEISKEFSLWKNSGSTYVRGNLFIIPIEQSLVYVEPVYLVAANSSIPEVRRVIVVFGDKIAYKSTLGEALDAMFGAGAAPKGSGVESAGEPTDGSKPAGDMGRDELIVNANSALQRAVEAQRNGDWAGYGRNLQQLQEYISELYSGTGAAQAEATAITEEAAQTAGAVVE